MIVTEGSGVMGLIVFVCLLVLILPVYIVCALSEMHVLKLVKYDKVWMAWIPFANVYALMDGFKDVIIGFPLLNLCIGNQYFKITYFVSIILTFLGATANKGIGTIISLVLLMLNASIYTYIYAVMENKGINETKIIGLISAFIPLIAIIKFFMYNENNLVNNQLAYNIINSNVNKMNNQIQQAQMNYANQMQSPYGNQMNQSTQMQGFSQNNMMQPQSNTNQPMQMNQMQNQFNANQPMQMNQMSQTNPVMNYTPIGDTQMMNQNTMQQSQPNTEFNNFN